MLCRNRTSRLGQRRGLRPTGGAEPPRRGKRLQLRRGLPGEVQGDTRNYTTAAVFPIKIIETINNFSGRRGGLYGLGLPLAGRHQTFGAEKGK